MRILGKLRLATMAGAAACVMLAAGPRAARKVN